MSNPKTIGESAKAAAREVLIYASHYSDLQRFGLKSHQERVSDIIQSAIDDELAQQPSDKLEVEFPEGGVGVYKRDIQEPHEDRWSVENLDAGYADIIWRFKLGGRVIAERVRADDAFALVEPANASLRSELAQQEKWIQDGALVLRKCDRALRFEAYDEAQAYNAVVRHNASLAQPSEDSAR